MRAFDEMVFDEEVIDGFVSNEMFDADAVGFACPTDGVVPWAARAIGTFG